MITYDVCYCMGTGHCYTCQHTDTVAYHSATGGEPKHRPRPRTLVVAQVWEPVEVPDDSDVICDRCGAPKPNMASGNVGRLWAHYECLLEDHRV